MIQQQQFCHVDEWCLKVQLIPKLEEKHILFFTVKMYVTEFLIIAQKNSEAERQF